MTNNIVSAVVGFLFAIGLGISGMTNPQKVVSFLDVSGNWDPSLLFVMIGAVGVHFVLYRLIRRRRHPLFSSNWHVPQNRPITKSLIAGSLLFGMGWGIAGYCPGPAIVSLATLQSRPLLFLVSMLAGMMVFKIADRRIHFKR